MAKRRKGRKSRKRSSSKCVTKVIRVKGRGTRKLRICPGKRPRFVK